MDWGVLMVSIGLQLLVTWTSLVHGQGTLDTSPDVENDTSLPVEVFLKDGDSFDYIVVGAGAAGCAGAARLALLGFDVLLVEAGGDPNLLSKIPSAAMALLGSEVDWQYETVPNNVSCLSSRGRQCRFSRGKCLGGSTSINYMLYTRGNRLDFNFNITDWNWKDLEPYFLRYEGLQVLDQMPPSSASYHSTSGIVKLEFFDDPQNPWHSRIPIGYNELNFPNNRDVNGVSQIGVSKIVGYVYQGRRMSTAWAYLGRKDVQRNLKVAKYTFCTSVIIDDNNFAIGVTLLHKLASKTIQVFAKKEVILSAGTIGTPQILMLSGIGPAKHLEEMGIPLRANLPVGNNMTDHVLPLIILLVDKGIQIAKDVGNLFKTVGKVKQFVASRNGALASNGLTDVNVFANTLCYNEKRRQLNNNTVDCQSPNMQIIHAYLDRNLLPLAQEAFQTATNLNDDVTRQLAAANIDNAFIIISPIVLKPFSRGHIRLASSDPSKPPAIFPNYISDRRDIDEMLRSIKIIEHLVQTEEFKKYNASILHLKFPGCPSYKKGRNHYWRCYVRHMTYSVFHAVGTCSLNQVVDIKLRVKGIQGLRVADASVFPSIMAGNTEAPTIAVGERVVDFIKESSKQENI